VAVKSLAVCHFPPLVFFSVPGSCSYVLSFELPCLVLRLRPLGYRRRWGYPEQARYDNQTYNP
jgi:hypothetical protein